MNLGVHLVKPCGKYFDRSVYIHKDYAHLCEKIDMNIVDEYAKELPKDFEYTLIRYDRAEKKGMVSVSFINLVNFDSADMPLVGDSYHVKGWGWSHISKRYNRVRLIRMKNDPQIKTHKWLYVTPDYKGFDWNEAVNFSKRWTEINHNAPQKLSHWIEFLKTNKLPVEHWHDSYLPTSKIPVLIEDLKFNDAKEAIAFQCGVTIFIKRFGYTPSLDNKKDIKEIEFFKNIVWRTLSDVNLKDLK
jgi:hypothetical protein